MGWRKIEVDGQDYRWKCGDYVVIQDSDGKRVGPNSLGAWTLKGISVYDWERAQHKRSPLCAVTPKDISEFIRGWKETG